MSRGLKTKTREIGAEISTGVFSGPAVSSEPTQIRATVREEPTDGTNARALRSEGLGSEPRYTANCLRARRECDEQSLLTPDLREFIDRIVVPILVRQFILKQSSSSEQVAQGCEAVAELPSGSK